MDYYQNAQQYYDAEFTSEQEFLDYRASNTEFRIVTDVNFIKPLDLDAHWMAVKWQILMAVSDFENPDSEISMLAVPTKFNQLQIKFGTSKGNEIAWADSPLTDTHIIWIDAQKWMKLNGHQRFWLLHHEVLHEIWGVYHGSLGELMFPVLPALDNPSVDCNSGRFRYAFNGMNQTVCFSYSVR